MSFISSFKARSPLSSFVDSRCSDWCSVRWLPASRVTVTHLEKSPYLTGAAAALHPLGALANLSCLNQDICRFPMSYFLFYSLLTWTGNSHQGSLTSVLVASKSAVSPWSGPILWACSAQSVLGQNTGPSHSSVVEHRYIAPLLKACRIDRDIIALVPFCLFITFFILSCFPYQVLSWVEASHTCLLSQGVTISLRKFSHVVSVNRACTPLAATDFLKFFENSNVNWYCWHIFWSWGFKIIGIVRAGAVRGLVQSFPVDYVPYLV